MEDIKELYNMYANDIYRFIISLTLNHEAAEDIMQNTFISAMKSLNTFKGHSTVKTWLIGIAKNEYYTYLRKSPISVNLDDIHEISYRDEDKEIYMSVMEEIYKLSDPQKQILILRLIIEEHLRQCDECFSYLKLMSDDINIEVQVEKNEIDKSGEKIVKKIKKSQDRIKYIFIIFSMIVAVISGILLGKVVKDKIDRRI